MENWLNMESSLQLDSFFISKLNINFTPPPAGEDASDITQMKTRFSYDLAQHDTDPLKFCLTFSIISREVTDKDIHIGRSVEATVDGYFSFQNDSSEDQRAILSRVNGVSILYGLLRGIVMNATGCFPFGPLMLPMFMPQKIVAIVEQDRMRNEEKAKISASSQAASD